MFSGCLGSVLHPLSFLVKKNIGKTQARAYAVRMPLPAFIIVPQNYALQGTSNMKNVAFTPSCGRHYVLRRGAESTTAALTGLHRKLAIVRNKPLISKSSRDITTPCEPWSPLSTLIPPPMAARFPSIMPGLLANFRVEPAKIWAVPSLRAAVSPWSRVSEVA